MSRVEKIADNVLALTDVVPIDGRLSWRPPKARGFEPCNKYVVLSDERAMLFDTGYAVHGESLIASLREVASDATFRAEILKRGFVAQDSAPPDALAAYVKSEIVRWGDVVRKAGAAGIE